jgi:hypothetical protein
LIEQDGAVDQTHISRDDRTQRQFYDIAANQSGGGDRAPRPISPHRCNQRQPRLESVQRGLRPALLDKAERGVEDQQKGDDAGLDIFAKADLEENCRLEHPRYRRP